SPTHGSWSLVDWKFSEFWRLDFGYFLGAWDFGPVRRNTRDVVAPGLCCDGISFMKYEWKDAGEEWSEPWGTSAAQWSGAILPRIRDCLPTGTILEIAAGFGRWTHYLKDYCQEL